MRRTSSPGPWRTLLRLERLLKEDFRPSAPGVTEIRIHGVGGTPPEVMLDDPHLRKDSGDQWSGFYTPVESHESRGRHHRIKALSWGQLTAGHFTRALWVLLLPFALANLAGWAQPPRISGGEKAGSGTDRWDRRANTPFFKAFSHAFGLSLTMMFVFAIATIALDSIALQCGSQATCWNAEWWLQPLGNRPAAERLLLGALIPLAALGLIHYAGGHSVPYLEGYTPERPAGENPNSRRSAGTPGTESGRQMRLLPVLAKKARGGPDSPYFGLRNRMFWRGGKPITRTRRLHLAAGLVTISFALGQALLSIDFESIAFLKVEQLVLLDAVLLAVFLLLISLPGFHQRFRVRGGDRVTSGALVLAWVVLVFPVLTPWFSVGNEAPGSPGRTVAQYETTAHVLTLLHSLSLLAVTAILLVVAWRRRAHERERPAFMGLGVAVLSILALFLVTSFWSGAAVRTADVLGCARPYPEGAGGRSRGPCPVPKVPGTDGNAVPQPPIFYPAAHEKTAVTFFVVLIAIVLTLFTERAAVRSRGRRNFFQVCKDFRLEKEHRDDPDERRRIRAVGGAYELMPLVRRADADLGRIVLLGSLVALEQHLGWVSGLADRVLPAGIFEWLDPSSIEGTFLTICYVVICLVPVILAVLLPVGHRSSVSGDAPSDEAPALVRAGSAAAGGVRAAARPFNRPAIIHLLVLVFALAGALSTSQFNEMSEFITFSTWAVTLIPVLGAALLYAALRNPRARRGVGAIWDVATFWPRQSHPYAPPCYAERLVPQLQAHVHWLSTPADGDPNDVGEDCRRVILSAHSQGTVVAFAALAQSEDEDLPCVILFTYGSPLQILYRRIFPAYFGGGILLELGQRLAEKNRAAPRWRHFYSRTDPLGDRMFRDDPDRPDAALEELVNDHPSLLDPHTWETLRGEPPLEMTGHSTYLRHPVFRDRLNSTIDELMKKFEEAGCFSAAVSQEAPAALQASEDKDLYAGHEPLPAAGAQDGTTH